MKELIEQLADIEHQRWADWQRYMHSKCTSNSYNGRLSIPAELVTQWERQIDTPYADLSEAEKESDRDQVRRYWPLIEELQADVARMRVALDEYVRLDRLGLIPTEELQAVVDALKDIDATYYLIEGLPEGHLRNALTDSLAKLDQKS